MIISEKEYHDYLSGFTCAFCSKPCYRIKPLTREVDPIAEGDGHLWRSFNVTGKVALCHEHYKENFHRRLEVALR